MGRLLIGKYPAILKYNGRKQGTVGRFFIDTLNIDIFPIRNIFSMKI